MLPVKSVTPAEAAGMRREVIEAPEVFCDGAIYDVARVGMVGSPLHNPGPAFLQTTAGKLYRLPAALTPWAFDLVALANTFGSPFPCKVEFDTVDGRITADLL
jgi:hypothetical protein